MSRFGGESGSCPHCGTHVRFVQQFSSQATKSSGERAATGLITLCPSCEQVVVFVIRGLDDYEKYPAPASTPSETMVAHGSPHAAYIKIRYLVEHATQRVWIADAYMDRSIFDLLSNTGSSVDIRLLTRPANLPRDFAHELGLFRRQQHVRCNARLGIQDQHDRYLIIDDKAFLSGASIKDLGVKESMFVEIVDLRDDVVASFDTRWNGATTVT